MTQVLGHAIGKIMGLSCTIPSPPGKYTSIGCAMHRVKDGTLAQFFYPGDDKAHAETKAHPYMRQESIQGLAQWLGYPTSVLYSCKSKRHPFRRNIPLHKDFLETDTMLPIVIFSHGLGGNAEMYSKICGDIASHGYLVIALEHEDGSGSYAHREGEASPIYLQVSSQPGDPFSRENSLSFRKPQLQRRRKEIRACLTYIRQVQKLETHVTSQDIVEILIRHSDLQNAWLAGHSMGAATAVTVSADSEISGAFQGYVLLDLWPTPIEDDVLDKGIQKPTISILSEQFLEREEIELTHRLMMNSSAHHLIIPGTQHQQYSDSPFLMRRHLSKRTFAEGTTRKEVSQEALIKSVLAFLRSDSEKAIIDHEYICSVDDYMQKKRLPTSTSK